MEHTDYTQDDIAAMLADCAHSARSDERNEDDPMIRNIKGIERKWPETFYIRVGSQRFEVEVKEVNA